MTAEERDAQFEVVWNGGPLLPERPSAYPSLLKACEREGLAYGDYAKIRRAIRRLHEPGTGHWRNRQQRKHGKMEDKSVLYPA